MAGRRFDPSKVEIWGSKDPYSRRAQLLYNGEGLDPKQEKAFFKWYDEKHGVVKESPSTKPAAKKNVIPDQYRRMFLKDDFFKPKVGRRTNNTLFSSRGKVKDAFKNLTLKGGRNPDYGAYNPVVRDVNGNLKPIYGKSPTMGLHKYGSNINRGTNYAPAGAAVLDGFKDWQRHLKIAAHAVTIQAANFRTMLLHRAIKVFQDSFEKRQFYSKGSKKWAPLAEFTKKKRSWRGTGTKILEEYGDLRASFKNTGDDANTITTGMVAADPKGKHKFHTLCYAGFHNEGVGTYGRKSANGKGGKPYIQRQFMGHSTYLDPLVDPFISKMTKIYLFDSVFLIKVK